MSKKKVVVTTQKKKTSPTTSRRGQKEQKNQKKIEMVFKKDNFIWMGIGIALIALGMILMLGGSMPSPDVWDDSIIYSWRRTVLAPVVILIGLGMQVYAIFKK
ncbi:MAG: DUF3098 domain-containing protein [Bacteroidetes bacterium]|jgi:hypothetical protein|nr:DUF3098 domain-containing protein [Bacteroidota bacterium]MDF1864070.1 DUF3098 domain-containing protein [Saprospiraceae bacterium]